MAKAVKVSMKAAGMGGRCKLMGRTGTGKVARISKAGRGPEQVSQSLTKIYGMSSTGSRRVKQTDPEDLD